MTTPHKSLLIQARDALLSACGGRCNAEYNPCDYKEVADALTAYIDAPEPEPAAWMNNKRDMTYFGHYNKDDLPLYTHPPAVREPIHQALTDPENQPNQYGIEFGMRGSQMTFTIGSQSFTLAYEPDEPGEFEYMRDMLIKAFSIFTPDVKIKVRQPLSDAEIDAAWRSVDYQASYDQFRLDVGRAIEAAVRTKT